MQQNPIGKKHERQKKRFRLYKYKKSYLPAFELDAGIKYLTSALVPKSKSVAAREMTRVPMLEDSEI